MPKRNRIDKETERDSLWFLGLAAMVLAPVIAVVFAVFRYVEGDLAGVKLSLLLMLAYICIMAIVGVVAYIWEKNSRMKAKENMRVKQTEDFPLGLLARFEQPVAVCDDEGKIVWMNWRFANRSPKQVLIGDDVNILGVLNFKDSEYVGESDMLDSPSELSANALLTKLAEKRIGATAKGVKGFGGEWTVHSYHFMSNASEFYAVVLTEDTVRNAWINRYNENLVHVAYIAIDNLEELAQSEQESYRTASTQVDAIIKEWASEYEAFIKEYEREKYVVMTTHKALVALEKKRFDLLERVSKIHIGSENLSVTVSMGVSPETGTLEEKDKSAQSALETALQRGGNQVVVMGETTRFYGAKAITSLKRSGVRHRVFADKLMHRMNACSNVIIMGHRNPDFDAIGSCAGIARLALSLGKPTNIIANKEDPTLRDCFAKLLTIPEYENIFVDATDAQEKLTSDTLVICSDVNNPDNFEAINVAKNADYLFIIDHHRQSEKTWEAIHEHREMLIVPSASSASELISEILELELPPSARLHHEEADIMFAGILLDTKNFTRNTQVPTFGAAIYLRNNGADPVKAQALFKTGLDDFRQEGAFTTDLEIYRDFIVIARETSHDVSPAKRITAAKTADRLLNIKNVRASFVVAKMQNDVFISARSDGSVNVQLIMESLKGGGHYNAAATVMKETTVETVVEKLKESVSLYFGAEDTPLPQQKKRRRRIARIPRRNKKSAEQSAEKA